MTAVKTLHMLWCCILLSHDLSQVHGKGDLGGEVDGMTRKRRRLLQRVPEAFEPFQNILMMSTLVSCVQRFSIHDLPLVVVSLCTNWLTTQRVSSRVVVTVRCASIRLLLGILPSLVGVVTALV